jgi:hypothetical protein
MNVTVWHRYIAVRAVVVLIGTIGAIGAASAEPRTMNSSGLTPQQCYQKDSDCTQFCGAVTGDLRYECFGICDRMLDKCLDTGDWNDSSRELDPGPRPGRRFDDRVKLEALLIRMLMVAGDTNGDGSLPLKEIQALKDKVFEKEDSGGEKKTDAVRRKQ